MTTRITVDFVNPPKPGKLSGSVKASDGNYYGIKPDQLALFEPKGVYDIEFTSRMFNNKEYYNVTSVKKIESAPPPQAGNGAVVGKYGPKDDATAERIFVCGALNALLQGGHVECSQVYISNVVNVLRASWAETFAGQANVHQSGPER